MSDIELIKEHLEVLCRTKGISASQAGREMVMVGAAPELVDSAITEMEMRARELERLDFPRGVNGWNYRHQISDVKRKAWYTGPATFDAFWPEYLKNLTKRVPQDALRDIDATSTKSVAQLCNPGARGIKKKGLALGYVQAGKTANYTAVIAKAADAGFRLIIVLAGIHNSLRRQTQKRLEADLGLSDPQEHRWVPLTNAESDFGNASKGSALASQRDLRLLAVVKKNPRRLENLIAWLDNIPLNVREGLPALIIDDEADQATPNSQAAKNRVSRINELMRNLLDLLPTSTYLGYTATPFANVLIDPEDESDLYPSDFIIDIPRPSGYFGAESIFGIAQADDEEDPIDGLDIVREIPPDDIPAITPPSRKVDRPGYAYSIPESLGEALRWFVVAVAIKRCRRQHGHSSMLIHTTPLVQPQFEIAELVRSTVGSYSCDDDAFRASFDREFWRVSGEEWELAEVSWPQVRGQIPAVLEELRVVVDNGASDDRLDYDRRVIGQDGKETPAIETVVAVGGNTLSRGLTLEGLMVSYFCRRVGTYDTLLQMGRWFGFRNGYQDLPRVWVTPELLNQFRFLSTVEQEIRDDIARYETEGLTPQDLALRIRRHPSMAVTAKSKMHHARKLNISYGGKRLQTFRFHHRDPEMISANLDSVRRMVRECECLGLRRDGFPASRVVFQDVPSAVVKEFLTQFRFHEDHRQLDGRAMVTYLNERTDAAAEKWNVVLAGGSSRYRTVDGQQVDLGAADLGLAEPINMINRARLESVSDSGLRSASADVKAVMSRQDRFLDIPAADIPTPLPNDEVELARIRERQVDGRGILILYPISPDSIPMGRSRITNSREKLNAAGPVIGVGIIFPAAAHGDQALETEYVGLELHGTEAESLEDEEEYEAELERDDDDEPDSQVDGSQFVPGDSE